MGAILSWVSSAHRIRESFVDLVHLTALVLCSVHVGHAGISCPIRLALRNHRWSQYSLDSPFSSALLHPTFLISSSLNCYNTTFLVSFLLPHSACCLIVIFPKLALFSFLKSLSTVPGFRLPNSVLNNTLFWCSQFAFLILYPAFPLTKSLLTFPSLLSNFPYPILCSCAPSGWNIFPPSYPLCQSLFDAPSSFVKSSQPFSERAREWTLIYTVCQGLLKDFALH